MYNYIINDFIPKIYPHPNQNMCVKHLHFAKLKHYLIRTNRCTFLHHDPRPGWTKISVACPFSHLAISLG